MFLSERTLPSGRINGYTIMGHRHITHAITLRPDEHEMQEWERRGEGGKGNGCRIMGELGDGSPGRHSLSFMHH